MLGAPVGKELTQELGAVIGSQNVGQRSLCIYPFEKLDQARRSDFTLTSAIK